MSGRCTQTRRWVSSGPGLGKGFEPEMVGEKENDFSFKEGDLLV
jgi:hypothetical protein